MPPLANRRHEIFSQLVASGMAATKAYIKAGYKSDPKCVRSMALKKRIDVKTRIAEVRPIVERRKSAAMAREIAVNFENDDVTSRVGRAGILAERRRLLLRVMESRSIDPDVIDVPGGSTGTVIVGYKSVGFKTYKTHAVDIKLLAELRATEEQIARELEQREKEDRGNDDDSPKEIVPEWLQNHLKETASVESVESVESKTASQPLDLGSTHLDRPNDASTATSTTDSRVSQARLVLANLTH